jgi:hypothetical protein
MPKYVPSTGNSRYTDVQTIPSTPPCILGMLERCELYGTPCLDFANNSNKQYFGCNDFFLSSPDLPPRPGTLGRRDPSFCFNSQHSQEHALFSFIERTEITREPRARGRIEIYSPLFQKFSPIHRSNQTKQSAVNRRQAREELTVYMCSNKPFHPPLYLRAA